VCEDSSRLPEATLTAYVPIDRGKITDSEGIPLQNFSNRYYVWH
jgi:hypothetical protein